MATSGLGKRHAPGPGQADFYFEQALQSCGEDLDGMIAMQMDDEVVPPEEPPTITEEDLGDDEELYAKHLSKAREVADASIHKKTTAGYMSVVNKFAGFCAKKETDFNVKKLTPQLVAHILAYLFLMCGPVEEGGGGKTFSTAQKIRAALSWFWSETYPQYAGSTNYVVKEDASCSGLPTHAREVRKFLIGLEKEKARRGEVPESARALTLHDMFELWKLNILRPENPAEGAMKWCAYLTSFLLMLRMEETCRVMCESVDVPVAYAGRSFSVKIGVRKQAQTGDNRKRWLHARVVPEEHWLCPYRALTRWTYFCRGELHTGPLFRRVGKGLRGVKHDEALTQANLQHYLWKDLQTIGNRDWALYGTHSFRRGGCQWRNREGTPIAELGLLGGWTAKEAQVLMKYLFSPNDDPSVMEDIDRPERKRRLVDIEPGWNFTV